MFLTYLANILLKLYLYPGGSIHARELDSIFVGLMMMATRVTFVKQNKSLR